MAIDHAGDMADHLKQALNLVHPFECPPGLPKDLEFSLHVSLDDPAGQESIELTGLLLRPTEPRSHGTRSTSRKRTSSRRIRRHSQDQGSRAQTGAPSKQA